MLACLLLGRDTAISKDDNHVNWRVYKHDCYLPLHIVNEKVFKIPIWSIFFCVPPAPEKIYTQIANCLILCLLNLASELSTQHFLDEIYSFVMMGRTRRKGKKCIKQAKWKKGHSNFFKRNIHMENKDVTLRRRYAKSLSRVRSWSGSISKMSTSTNI